CRLLALPNAAIAGELVLDVVDLVVAGLGAGLDQECELIDLLGEPGLALIGRQRARLVVLGDRFLGRREGCVDRDLVISGLTLRPGVALGESERRARIGV